MSKTFAGSVYQVSRAGGPGGAGRGLARWPAGLRQVAARHIEHAFVLGARCLPGRLDMDLRGGIHLALRQDKRRSTTQRDANSHHCANNVHLHFASRLMTHARDG